MDMIEFDPETEAKAIRDAARKLGDKHPEAYGELANSGRIKIQGFPAPVMARIAMPDGTTVYFMREVSGAYKPWIY